VRQNFQKNYTFGLVIEQVDVFFLSFFKKEVRNAAKAHIALTLYTQNSTNATQENQHL
jgi:hypothetical protein